MRVGNAAYRQRQHDVWGAVIYSVYIHTKNRDHLDDRIWPILKHQVESALAHWREPDQGIWEVRGEPKHFTSSKLMCWVAAERGARLARMRDDLELAERWQAAADEIHADICAHAVDERGVFTQHYDTDALDASVLLMPLFGFLPPDDPRMRATVLAIADELTEDGLVLALPGQGDRRRADGRGGDLHHLLVLAGLGAGPDRREGAGPAPVREASVPRQPARPLRRGDRSPQRPPPGQLPPGLHPSGA